MSAPTVLVVGAGGSAVGAVVPALARRSVHVRGLVRDESKRDRVLAQGASEVVVGDLTDTASIARALQGVDRAFYVAPAFLTDEADVGVAFVEAAQAAGVQRIVASSVIHPSLSLVNHAAKRPLEEAIYDSGLEHTVLQPALFFQNLDSGWARAVETGTFAEPWSTTTRFSRVDYRDVAEVAARALVDDDLLGGTFELASHGQHDRHDIARLITEITGRPVSAARVEPSSAAAAGTPLLAMFEHYDHAGILSSPITLTALLGRQPRSLRDYFQELAGHRQEGRP